MDYGPAFDVSLKRHIEKWEPPVHADDYKSAWDFEIDDEVHTIEEVGEYPPSYITVRCWIGVEELEDEDDEGWFEFVMAENHLIDATVPCTVVSADYDEESGQKVSYRITVERDGKKVKVKDVPWDAITFTERR